MVSFEDVDGETKKKMLLAWKNMDETNKVHFVNQVALALSIWGSDEKGKKRVADVLTKLMDDGSTDLSDFGIYISLTLKPMGKKEERAAKIIEKYRMKHNLPSVPHKPII